MFMFCDSGGICIVFFCLFWDLKKIPTFLISAISLSDRNRDVSDNVTKAMIGLKMTVTLTEKLGSSALTVPYSYFKGAQNKSDGCQE